MLNIQNLMGMQKLGPKGGLLPSEGFPLQIAAPSMLYNDATTYYVGNGRVVAGAPTDVRVYVPKKCRIKKIFLYARASVIGTSEPATVEILVNGITAYTVSTNWIFTGNSNPVSNTSLDILVNEDDFISIKITTPTRATNPTMIMNGVLWCEPTPMGPGEYLVQGGVTFTPVGTTQVVDASAAASTRMYIPKSGIITAAFIAIRCATPSSNEQFTYAVRVNNTTDYNITTTAKLDAAIQVFENISMSVPVTEGEYLCLRLIAPTRGTPPGSTVHSFKFVIQYT